MSDPHLSYDRSLGFSLRKPASWEFMPPAWSPVAQLRNSGEPSWAWIKAQPFCVARQLHESRRHAYPTLQVTARAFQVPTETQARALLDAQIGALSKVYGQVDVQEAGTDALIDGHPAITIRAGTALSSEIDGEQVAPGILRRLRIIFAPGRAFSIGMSSSLDPKYYQESEFEQMVASIRIP